MAERARPGSLLPRSASSEPPAPVDFMQAYLYLHAVMKQITVRGVSGELGKRLSEVSRSTGKSLNSTVLDLLSQAVGLSDRRAWLERFATWEPSEVEEVDRAVRSQRTIDAKLWK